MSLPPDGKIMATMNEFRLMAVAMDHRMRQLAAARLTDRELLHRMAGHLPELHKIWVGTSDRELAMLCRDYPGFYRYASLMEEAFEEERAKPVPDGNLPELNDALKQLLSALLTSAVALERGYQSLIDAEQPEAGLLAKLNARHSRWMADRERFPELLNKGGAPERVLKLVASATGEMASRIAQLRSHIHRHGVTN